MLRRADYGRGPFSSARYLFTNAAYLSITAAASNSCALLLSARRWMSATDRTRRAAPTALAFLWSPWEKHPPPAQPLIGRRRRHSWEPTITSACSPCGRTARTSRGTLQSAAVSQAIPDGWFDAIKRRPCVPGGPPAKMQAFAPAHPAGDQTVRAMARAIGCNLKALLRDSDGPARPIDNDHTTSASRCRTSGGHPLRPRAPTRARNGPRLFAAPDFFGAKRSCPVARREDCPSLSMTAALRSSFRRTQPRTPTCRVSVEGGQRSAESNRARIGKHLGPAGRPRSITRCSVHSAQVRDRRIRVTVRIFDPPLKRCTRPSAGASSQVHGRRKLAVGDPSVHGGTTQRGDPDHVGHAKERRAGRRLKVNIAAVGVGFDMHDKSSKWSPTFKGLRLKVYAFLKSPSRTKRRAWGDAAAPVHHTSPAISYPHPEMASSAGISRACNQANRRSTDSSDRPVGTSDGLRPKPMAMAWCLNCYALLQASQAGAAPPACSVLRSARRASNRSRRPRAAGVEHHPVEVFLLSVLCLGRCQLHHQIGRRIEACLGPRHDGALAQRQRDVRLAHAAVPEHHHALDTLDEGQVAPHDDLRLGCTASSGQGRRRTRASSPRTGERCRTATHRTCG